VKTKKIEITDGM